MIYIILALVVFVGLIISFISGMYVYRQGMNDGMKRSYGAVDLPPLFEQKEKPIPNEDIEARIRLKNYHGTVKR